MKQRLLLVLVLVALVIVACGCVQIEGYGGDTFGVRCDTQHKVGMWTYRESSDRAYAVRMTDDEYRQYCAEDSI